MCKRGRHGHPYSEVQLLLRGLGTSWRTSWRRRPRVVGSAFPVEEEGCQAAVVTSLEIEVSFLPFLGTGFWFLAKIRLLKTPTGLPKGRQLRRDGGRWRQVDVGSGDSHVISFAVSAPVTYVERWGMSV